MLHECIKIPPVHQPGRICMPPVTYFSFVHKFQTSFCVYAVIQSCNCSLYTLYRKVEASEGLRTQIGLQKQLHEQLEVGMLYPELVWMDTCELSSILLTWVGSLVFPSPQIQRKMQLQVEEHSKYLEMVIAKQGESLRLLGALPRFQHVSAQAPVDHREAYREEQTASAEESPSEKE